MIDSLKTPGKAGRRPIVRHCPYCHTALSATKMRAHLPQCERAHQTAPPQAALPADLENQELSRNPLQRTRQLEEQEQDRIERTTES